MKREVHRDHRGRRPGGSWSEDPGASGGRICGKDDQPARDGLPGGLRAVARPLEDEPVLTVPAGRVIVVLGGKAATLAVLGLAATQLDRWQPAQPWFVDVQESLVRLFSLDGEANVPTWFSTVLLLICAAVAFLNSRLASERNARGRWLLIALLFLAMSLDEAALLHEMSIKPLRQLMGTSGLLYYAWVIPGAMAVCAVAAYYWRFVLGLPRPVSRRLIAGAGLYVLGALIIEAFTGAVEEQSGRNMVYDLAATAEESLEMVGLVVIISGLLLQARKSADRFCVQL